MHTVLVTGGAGYIGSVLVPKLLNKGYTVKVFDLCLFNKRTIPIDTNNTRLTLIKDDIRHKESVIKALKGVDTVIHLAAISNDPCSDLNPELTRQVNYNAVEELVVLTKEAEVDRFINASSSSVYGVKDVDSVTEDLALEPITLYAKYKAETEEIVQKENSSSFTTVSIRSATACGYSQRLRLDLTVNILANHAINKGKITVFGGQQKRPNINVQDIADLYCLLVEVEKDKIGGQVFNAGFENHKVIELAEIVKNIINKNIKIEVTDSYDDRSYHISSEKIRKQLGFIPKYTIEDAVLSIQDAFKKGKVEDPEDIRYYNIKTMKALGW